MNLEELKHYLEVVIPNLEYELSSGEVSGHDLIDRYNLYVEVLRIVAPHDFGTYNRYLELDEDHTDPNRAFYHHRREHLAELVGALNDMEIHDKYDTLLISMPPRVGKSTFGIRFLSWIIGRKPEKTQLGTSYSDSITTSFYNGVMEIVSGQRFHEIFPEANLVLQNAKREEIWLKKKRRYPSISFVPIGGSMTGRAEAGDYLYCDDLVSGIEEALSIVRLGNLWQKYTVNAKQRKKEGCKEIHIATNWSVHDPMSKLKYMGETNPRFKVLDIPCYNDDGESNFNFFGGFSTKYYKEMENDMDEASFSALYMQEPIEREGILYNPDELQYFMSLPQEKPDTVVAVCDSKNLGKDNVSLPVAKLYGDMVYIDDVVYNNGLPQVTTELVANKLIEHKVVRADVEMNNGGNYYAETVEDLVKSKGGNTSLRLFFTGNNKDVKIITYSDFVKKRFIFRHPSTYHPKSEYAKFMKDVCRWTQTGKNPHDDAPDTLAMLASLIQDLEGSAIKVLNRRELGL